MWLADLFGSSREKRFFNILAQHATLLYEAANELAKYVDHPGAALAASVAKLEERGNAALAELIDSIRGAFVTPLDRTDLYNLGETIDDMLDYLNNAAAEIELFQVTVTPEMRSMCETLCEAANHVMTAVRQLDTDPGSAYTNAKAVAETEQKIEGLYRKALARLFAGSDVSEMFKAREVYRHLSNSADRAEAIGKLIGKIVVKNT
jgi:predicted phosphate transport protein (TIGR00153 family)